MIAKLALCCCITGSVLFLAVGDLLASAVFTAASVVVFFLTVERP